MKPQQMDKRPLVAIGVPAGDRVHTEFAQCLWGQGRGAKNHRQGIVFGSSSIITNARNQCVDGAHGLGANYIMCWDSDMMAPYTTIDRLLGHDKDVVGCTYVRRGPPFDILGKVKHDHDKDKKTGLIEYALIPTGILLIKMSVFLKMTEPFFRLDYTAASRPGFTGEGRTRGEDFYFSKVMTELGYRMWIDLDLSAEISHIYQYPLKTTDLSVQATADTYAQDQKRLKVANG